MLQATVRPNVQTTSCAGQDAAFLLAELLFSGHTPLFNSVHLLPSNGQHPQQLDFKQQRLTAVVCQLPLCRKRGRLRLQHAADIPELRWYQHAPLASLPHAYDRILQAVNDVAAA
jgi:hypothetical protein